MRRRVTDAAGVAKIGGSTIPNVYLSEWQKNELSAVISAMVSSWRLLYGYLSKQKIQFRSIRKIEYPEQESNLIFDNSIYG